jgi:NAD+ kinase
MNPNTLRIAFIGRYIDDILPFFSEHNIVEVDNQPDFVVTHGGDGTLLEAERSFPGVPKFPIRDQKTAPTCDCHSYKNIIEDFFSGKLEEQTLIKIAGSLADKSVIGINDIFLHNENRAAAIRYRVFINDELYADDVVADGVGVATVHGSTAYYRSITHSTFRVGIGLAFSNTTEVTNHIVLPEDSLIKIQVTRGPAILLADNSPNLITVEEGDEILINKIDETAKVIGLKQFMCPQCRKLRYSRKHKFLQENIYKEPLV